MSSKIQIRFFLSWLASVYLMAASTSVQAAEMALARNPLFLGTQISPNIFFMLDDSGSMDWETLTPSYNYFSNYFKSGSTKSVKTGGVYRGDDNSGRGSCANDVDYRYIFDNSDSVYDGCDLEDGPGAAVLDWRVRSSDLNIMYYNPSATYQSWQGFSNAAFSSARSNPQSGSSGYNQIRDLSGFTYAVWEDNLGFDADGTAWGTAKGPDSVVDGANGIVDLWDNHTLYTVNNTNIDVVYLNNTFASIEGASVSECNKNDADESIPYEDCYGGTRTTATINSLSEDPYGRTVDEAKQNIANWY
jgi:type IV pilus assembly protein PilY1